MELKSDCIQFLRGLSFNVDEQRDAILAEKKLHNRTDNIRVELLLDTEGPTIRRGEWEATCARLGKEPVRLGKYVVVRDDVQVTQRHHEEAKRNRFVVSTFSDFLARFTKLDDLRLQIRKVLESEYKIDSVLKSAFVDPHVTIGPDGKLHPATELLSRYWVEQQQKGLLVLLAPPGHGKSTLTAVVASRLLSTKTLPFLIPFASYKRLVDFQGLIYNFFVKHQHEPILPDALSIILKHRLALIILDGFDELCETAGITTARENLGTVYKGVESGGKILLTARTAFFRTAVSGSSQSGSSRIEWEEAHLEPFDQSQRHIFIDRRPRLLPGQRQKVKDLISAIPTADELASSPLVLAELCDFVDNLPAVKDFEHGIAAIYDWLLRRHCIREMERQRYDLNPDFQIRILCEVAYWSLVYWTQQDPTNQKARAEDVAQIITSVLEDERTLDRDIVKNLTPKIIGHAIFNPSKSNSQNETFIRFLHHTWHDFLIALRIKHSIGKQMRDVPDIIKMYRVLPEYVAKFLAGMLDDKNAQMLFSYPELKSRDLLSQTIKMAQEYARRKHPGTPTNPAQGKFLLEILGLQSFADREIWQAQFVYLSLNGISFKNCALSDTSFRKCDLRGTDFSRATLARTVFDNCDLEGALFNDVRGLSDDLKARLIEDGAIVDGINHTLDMQQGLARKLVRMVLAKFRKESLHQEEPVWRRGFSPENQRRVRQFILPALKRHQFLVEVGGARNHLQRVESMTHHWFSWIDKPETPLQGQVAKVIEEVAQRL